MSADQEQPRATVGRGFVALVALCYTAAVLVATYPIVTTFASRLPAPSEDPLQALWVMHWYRQCLLEGRSFRQCPDLQFPVGAHLGNFSPLQFQALVYLPLSFLTDNDVLCYNLVWLFNLVFTGLGTFALIWHVLRDRACACFGGLLAMLSGPVLLHAHGHLEIITLGWVPLFLVGWLRLLERPGWRRLLVAVGLYLLVALSAAYFALFAVVPACLSVLCQGFGQARGERLAWVKRRAGWLAAFAVLALPFLLLFFSAQLSSRAEGYSIARSKREFSYYGSPGWSLVTPSAFHTLGRLLPWDLYAANDYGPIESCSYLGLVSLGLIGWAAVTRQRFPQARYWWVLFGVLVLLSFGAYWRIGSFRLSLPAEWLRNGSEAFRLIRVPARFNLLVAVCGALLAAAGLHALLGRVASRARRVAVCCVLGILAVADLATVPFATADVPPVPPGYAWLRRRDPRGTFLEIPQYPSSAGTLNATLMFWQSRHQGKTTAGYSGFANVPYEYRLLQPSPFAWFRLADRTYLRDPEAVAVDLVARTRFVDYVWLYLTAHGLDHVVLHRIPEAAPEAEARVRAGLSHARVYGDDVLEVYDRTLLRKPQQPTLLCMDGWRQRFSLPDGRRVGALSKAGRVAVYNPNPDRALRFTLEAAALHVPRTVQLRTGGREVARWTVRPGELRTYYSPPFRLAGGLQELVLASDGEERPTCAEETQERDPTPYSLRIGLVGLAPDEGTDSSMPPAPPASEPD